MSLTLKHVSKSFTGHQAVNNISFALNHPTVFGLLGTNGAGKTTTIRMILGIITKDTGEITWHDQPINRKNVNFGYLPEERGVYPKVKIRNQLAYFAELKGLNKTTAHQAIEHWAEILKITEYLDLPAERLSKGNQQKIQFMTAVLHNPDLIILDEPFSGLDPVNTEIIKNIIINLVEQNKYIIMSAHQMPVIEEFCTDILILNRGRTVLQGNLDEIKSQYPANRIFINADQDIQEYIKAPQLKLEHHKGSDYTIRIKNIDSAHKLLNQLVTNHIQINKFEILKPTLNDIFIEKVEA